MQLGKGLSGLDVLLPSRQVILNKAVSPVQGLSAVVAKIRHEAHVFEHLSGHEIGAAGVGHGLAECLLGQFHVGSRLARLREDLLEVVHDLLCSSVLGGRQDLFAQHAVPVEHGGLDVLSSVRGVVQGDHGAAGDRQTERPVVVLESHHLPGNVGHVESWHEERRRNSQLANVLLDLGLAVEVVYVGQSAVGDCE